MASSRHRATSLLVLACVLAPLPLAPATLAPQPDDRFRGIVARPQRAELPREEARPNDAAAVLLFALLRELRERVPVRPPR